VQDDDLALPGRQRPDRGPQVEQLRAQRVGVGPFGVGAPAVKSAAPLALAGGPPRVAPALVERRGHHPGPQVLDAATLADLLHGARQCLLHRVLCTFGRPREQGDRPHEPHVVVLDQPVEVLCEVMVTCHGSLIS
jgi:hypothetical protein